MKTPKQLFEDFLKVKFVPKANDEGIPISKEEDDLTYKQIHDYVNGSIIDNESIAQFRTLSSDRQERYASYEDMLEDATIAAAMEMYADDATQCDNRTGKVIWVESDDETIAKAGNRLLDVLQIEEKTWRNIYSLCVYGDLYLRLYREGDNADYEDLLNAVPGQIRTKVQDESRPLEEYVEYIEDPSTIYDIQLKDKCAGFVRLKTMDTSTSPTSYHGLTVNKIDINNIDIYDRRSFVHISLSESINRKPELLAINNEETNKTTVYKIKTGKSILADAYNSSQTVKLLEDSLLLSRLTKSALIRLLQIEVGDMPKTEVESLLRRVKNMIEQKIALNKNTGEARSYNSPGPMENIVYFPTKNGKGVITVNNMGGDVNVKDIADIEYFNNKKLSALKTPKQFLNYDSPEGLGNGTSLTKISSRYAHTIMRIIKAYTSGITTLLNYFFIDKGLDYVNKFTVKMVSPSTIEDTERTEQTSNAIQQASDILSLIENSLNDEGKTEVIKYMLNKYLNLSDISTIIDKYSVPVEGDSDTADSDFGGIGDIGSDDGFGGSDMDFGSEPDEEISDTDITSDES